MLYTTIKIKDEEYKARLSARDCVELEKKLGDNPLNIFLRDAQSDKLPSIELLVAIFHQSLQKYHHSITLSDAYDLYDNYVDDGNTLEDFIPVILEIFEVSGFFRQPKEGKEKN